ncbi:MAG: hypothetical protein DPW09_32230 [Anaerolineae bacterium]|nr:hypothetical protein [Anaerolineales bacterium]MCQ3978118.1 hypothetical protein [Anaerolineae bacterium]
MSPVAKKFFTAALIYLLLGLLAQAVVLFDGWLGFNPLAYTASAATQQIFLLGWLTQLGLALLYERLETLCPCGIGDYEASLWDEESNQNSRSKIENRKSKIVNRKSSLWVFLLFNLGLPLVIIGQPGLALFGGNWLGAAAAVGGLLQLSAGLLLALQVWSALKNQRKDEG